MLFLRRLVWLFHYVQMLIEVGTTTKGRITLQKFQGGVWTSAVNGLHGLQKAELNQAGYTILDNMADPLFIPSAMSKAADVRMEYTGMKRHEV